MGVRASAKESPRAGAASAARVDGGGRRQENVYTCRHVTVEAVGKVDKQKRTQTLTHARTHKTVRGVQTKKKVTHTGINTYAMMQRKVRRTTTATAKRNASEGGGVGSACAAMLFAIGPLLEGVVCFSAFLYVWMWAAGMQTLLSSSSWNDAAVEISEYTLAEERKQKTGKKQKKK